MSILQDPFADTIAAKYSSVGYGAKFGLNEQGAANTAMPNRLASLNPSRDGDSPIRQVPQIQARRPV